MLKFAFSLGIYSYLILLLGLFGLINPLPIFIITICYIGYLFLNYSFLLRKTSILRRIKQMNISEKMLLLILGLLFFINFIGTLGPELAFDALWYHLTLPKLFIIAHRVYFIRDNLFYYSLLPKFAEMLYIPALVLSNEIGAKIINFSFGLLTCVSVFRIGRIYLTRYWSLIAVIVFYSNLVIDWLSITAYVDLQRIFFESTAMLFFLYYVKSQSKKHLVSSAILLGLAIATKIIALSSIPIFIVLIFFLSFLSMYGKIKNALIYIFSFLLVVMPWFVISFYYTKNPFYPLFSNIGPKNISLDFFNPLIFVKNFITVFLFAADPLNPFYLIVIPILILNYKKIINKFRYVFLYSIFSYLTWYVVTYSNIWYGTEQAGGARFLSAYIPVLSVLGIIAINEYKNALISKLLVCLIVIIAITSIIYRGAANAKYIPVILGFETKQNFLMRNLNFSFGDFYDEGMNIKTMVKDNTVLLLGMHNLYYVDFPFTLSEKNKFGYILIQNGTLPAGFSNAKFVYKNERSHVKLYKL